MDVPVSRMFGCFFVFILPAADTCRDDEQLKVRMAVLLLHDTSQTLYAES